MQPLPAAFPIAPAAPIHQADRLRIPLVSLERPDGTTQAIYDLLGLKTMVLIVSEYGETPYTVLRNHIVAARNAIEAAHKPGGSVAELAARIMFEPRRDLSVPVCQPRVSPIMAEVYRALGVDTVTLAFGVAQCTVLADSVDQAQEALGEPAPACAEASCLAAGAGACLAHLAPHRMYPAPGLCLQEYYVGEPSPVIRTLARLFGVSFARLVDDAGIVYWIPAGSPAYNLEQVALRLGICA